MRYSAATSKKRVAVVMGNAAKTIATIAHMIAIVEMGNAQTSVEKNAIAENTIQKLLYCTLTA